MAQVPGTFPHFPGRVRVSDPLPLSWKELPAPLMLPWQQHLFLDPAITIVTLYTESSRRMVVHGTFNISITYNSLFVKSILYAFIILFMYSGLVDLEHAKLIITSKSNIAVALSAWISSFATKHDTPWHFSFFPGSSRIQAISSSWRERSALLMLVQY